MEKTHKLVGVCTTSEYECGNCGKGFEETGGNSVSSSDPYDPPFDGDYVDCPHCGEELGVEVDE